LSDLLILLDKDIKRCEDVLKLNNYLEIVIAVEELMDKYRGHIEGLGSDNDRVWNYSKKDLENIMEKLKLHRDNLIKDYNETRINNISIDIESIIKNTKDEVQHSEELSIDKRREVIEILNGIDEIINEKISTHEKWFKLRIYMNYLSTEDTNIATKIIYIINIVLQNK
jgi:hypothetical protein